MSGGGTKVTKESLTKYWMKVDKERDDAEKKRLKELTAKEKKK